ncbi:MAG: hypothetical protein OIF57_03905 [Marinobacterium sp.]|nr:hypothetical protein [Marinobacterium sp.]
MSLTTLIFIFQVLPHTRDSYRNVGINDGRIELAYEISQKVGKEFGKTEELRQGDTVLFGVKSTSVIIKEVGGVKTLRVYE